MRTTLSSSLTQSASKPREIFALLQLALRRRSGGLRIPFDSEPAEMTDRAFCYAILDRVSRSFAMVIRRLPVELRDPVCLFYLALRALDTIEDDMSFPDEEKQVLLRQFHQISRRPGWRLVGIGDTPDYQLLLNHYPKVSRELEALTPECRKVVLDIARQMGVGMADFGEREIETMADYDHYCHFVAGLVGHGLAELFSASGLEAEDLRLQKTLANSMGLFLQKTNIIRDYHEDLSLSRRFWPREAWSPYAKTLDEFAAQSASTQALTCLNDLVADALRHVPDCLRFLRKLSDPRVFSFCAIPQVMAIGTLAKVCDNPDVFRKPVKMRKGLAARIALNTRCMAEVEDAFDRFTEQIAAKVGAAGPRAAKLHTALHALQGTPRIESVPEHPNGIPSRVLTR